MNKEKNEYENKQATIRGKSLQRLEDILLKYRSIVMLNDMRQYKKDVEWIETFLNRRGYEIRETLREEIWKRLNENKKKAG